MKKEFLILWILTGLVLSQVPVIYAGHCAPDGTVYREGCPREVLVTSICDASADPCYNFLLGPKPLTKTETKTITWSGNTDTVYLGSEGDGQIGCSWNCDGSNG